MTLSIGLILLISVIVHEVAHGYAADYLGDTTPRAMGRLSLNPLVHMDWLGSVLLPMLMMVSGASVWLGWAKPVPVNPRNFANPSRDMMLVAVAGPLSNLGLAGLASIGLKMIPLWASVGDVTPAIVLCQQAVMINAGLMVFNLMPIPPLDGSKIMLHWAAQPVRDMIYRIEPYGFVLIFMMAYLGVLMPIIRLFMVPVIRILV